MKGCHGTDVRCFYRSTPRYVILMSPCSLQYTTVVIEHTKSVVAFMYYYYTKLYIMPLNWLMKL